MTLCFFCLREQSYPDLDFTSLFDFYFIDMNSLKNFVN